MLPSTILRFPDVKAATGYPRSSIYWRIHKGLFPPPVRLGESTVGWPASEIEAINKARMAGKTDDEVRALVERLLLSRKLAA
jgi:prophage regulatory protein